MELQNVITEHRRTALWSVALVSAVRAAFGVVWVIDAYLTWRPEFASHYVGYLQNALQGQPGWLVPWFNLWIAIVSPIPGVFVWLTRIIETLIALGLVLGLVRKWTYILGGLFSLLIWSTAGGFGGPYPTGVSNLGPALAYVFVFALLILAEHSLGKTPYSLDYYIENDHPVWRRFAELAPEDILKSKPQRLPWSAQAAAMAALALALIFFLGSLQSALGAPPATPENASAAVSPLQLSSGGPISQTHEAQLPPLLGTGNDVSVTITTTHTNVEIANGVTYQAWTFNDTVPGPILHVRQGQTVHVTLVNKSDMQHSIDFHAAEIAPNVAYRSINPGETLIFSFVATTPGVFIYHCGTPPVLLHMANGMYGAIIVDPATPLPPADASYVIVQSEWYTHQVNGTLMAGDYPKMMAATPDEVVFNGVAFQYRDQPLVAKAGQRIRIYFVDAGPNLSSAFHVIGAIFSAVYPSGDMSQALTGVSTYNVAPGQGVIFDVVIPQPGKFSFVDHSMRSMMMGAAGVFDVRP